MKKTTLISAAVLAYCLLLTAYSFPQGAAINSTGASADSSAILDVSSTTHGLLIPRLTEAQKNAIPNPATSLMIFQTDGSVPGYYFNSGTPGSKNWVYLGNDNLGNHTATDSLNMNNNKIYNLATCTQNLDAANKLYVDSKVGAGGVSGCCSVTSGATELSSITANHYNYIKAAKYCDTLTEGGHNDWYVPTFEEVNYLIATSPNSIDMSNAKEFWTSSPDITYNSGYMIYIYLDGTGDSYYFSRATWDEEGYVHARCARN